MTGNTSIHRAFSLTELLVVIAIIILLLVIAVPAFRNLVENTERNLADNQLNVGVSAARDAAVRSDGGDAAAVFFFMPGGRVSVVPCVQVGVIDVDYANNRGTPDTTRFVTRDVFVPVGAVEPINLPKGWSVRGYAAPGTLGTSDPAAGIEPVSNGWYDSLDPNRISAANNWVFPETNFVGWTNTAGLASKGWQRQSFMIRFKAGTGSLDTSGREAIVIDPLPVDDAVFRNTQPWTNPSGGAGSPLLSRQIVLDPARYVRIAQNRAGVGAAAIRTLLGDVGPDTVLCRGVTEIVMYKEESLAGALGVPLNRTTGTIYAADTDNTTGPMIDPAVITAFGGSADELMEAVGEWIIGQYRPAGANGPVASDAKIYTLQRYLGQMREVVPEGAQEVTP